MISEKKMARLAVAIQGTVVEQDGLVIMTAGNDRFVIDKEQFAQKSIADLAEQMSLAGRRPVAGFDLDPEEVMAAIRQKLGQ